MAKLDQELEHETARVVKLVQQSDGHERASKRLQEKYAKLQCTVETVPREKADLEEVEGWEQALHELAGSNEQSQQEVRKLDNRVQN
ncbi:hypothetical protein N7447_001610 [Penicillium robsamsonii]|uniref:uncharacterized protein n=1 Tax=Penicillium robsamsonii TaxID=1792511 RepID=UPI002548B572|nr:uncharacterized protein N7447_001610 [Penicillium robsamsonii]KAJ5835584.1 hypothetical protein N7447_001610 [Penicillium robsamsonii]